MSATVRLGEVDRDVSPMNEPHGVGRLGESNHGARFQGEERREFRYLISVACAVICSWIARLTPELARFWIADRLGDLFYRTSPTYKANVYANVGQVLGERASSVQIERTTRNVFRTSSSNFADLLLVPHRRNHEYDDLVQVLPGGIANLDAALADGHGVLILTGHLGAFDLMGQVLHDRGYKLTVVTGRTTARFLFDAVTYLRRANGLELVEATPSGVRRAIQAIRRGECAVFVSDRDFFQNGRAVSFFGRATTLPPGIVRIARDTGATIVPVFGERVDRGHRMTIESGFKVRKSDDFDADLRNGLEHVAVTLEQAIARLPEQWVMFQRVWPLEPADPVRVFPVGSPLESDILERVGAALPRLRGKSQR